MSRGKLIPVFLAVICLSYTWWLNAQEPALVYQDVGDIKEHLQPQTWCIYQDSRGLIWIGTSRGLQRWDGNRLLNYSYSPFDSLGISAQNIISITEDTQENLWLGLGVAPGLVKFDLKKETFTTIPLPTDSLRWHPTYVKYDPSGFLWVSCRDGLFQYIQEKDSLVHIPVEIPDPQIKQVFEIGSMEFDTTDVLWVTDLWMRLYYFDPGKKRLIPQPFDNPQLPVARVHCNKISKDSKGHFWILGHRSELIRFNPYERTIKLVKANDTEYASAITDGGIQVDQDDIVWYGMANGLMRYDPKGQQITRLETSEIPNTIRDICIDSNGNIFVGTLLGVKMVDKRAFEVKKTSASREHLLKAGRWINQVIRDQDTYWIGTFNNGLLKYDAGLNKVSTFKGSGAPGGLSSNLIFNILNDENGRIWVNSLLDLQRYDPLSKKFEPAPVSLSPYIAKDEDGFFWICGVDSMLRFDPITYEIEVFKFSSPLNFLGGSVDFYPMVKDKDGIFWTGGTHGMYRINPRKGEWTRYIHNRNHPFSLPDNEILSILCDSKNRLWIGTSIGMFQVEMLPDSDSLKYSERKFEGRDLGVIYKMVEDDNGNVWIATQTGMYVLKSNGDIDYYTSRDGLPENPLLIRSLNKDFNGSIIAGTYEFLEFSPRFLEPNRNIPPVILTGFQVSGESIYPGKESPLVESILFADRIDLNYNQNFLRLEFAALNYAHPERNRYRYYMEGVDKDTIEALDRSYAEYTDLSPGKYKFWVTGSNNTGVWNPEGRGINIRIHPPWYKSGVASGTYFLFALLMIYVFIRWRTRRLHREKILLENEVNLRTIELQTTNQVLEDQKEEIQSQRDALKKSNLTISELDQIKTRFFTNVSHEFRTLITLIKGPVDGILDDKSISGGIRSKLYIVQRNAQRLTQLVNQLLDISKIDKGSMNLTLVNANVFDYAHAIAVSFTSVAESKKIQYRFNLPATDTTEMFDADKLEKILNNLLSNAFKFTDEGGKVVLEMSQIAKNNASHSMLEFTVTDTGYGIPEEEVHKIFDRFYQAESHLKKERGGTGIGLALTYDLIQLMHGSISVESETGKGSMFKISIPLGKDHLKKNEFTISEVDSIDHKYPKGHPEIPGLGNVHQSSKEQLENESSDLPKVLLVEDNEDIRNMLAEDLEAEFKVIEAWDGINGLKLAKKVMPDLVITDVMMPYMDGIEMCSRLKSELHTSHIPVIMLTAKTSLDAKLVGLETGADDYIPKPFDIKEVKSRSINLIEQRKKLREKFSSEITIEPGDIVITSADEKFLRQTIDIVENHMSNDQFDVSKLCEEINMSQSTLFRKLNALTNLSPVEFIRTIRLKRAASLLKQNYGNVSQVAMAVGFSNPSYFTSVFRKFFKVSPRKYKKSHNHSDH